MLLDEMVEDVDGDDVFILDLTRMTGHLYTENVK